MTKEEYGETVETQYYDDETKSCYFELWQIEEAFEAGKTERTKDFESLKEYYHAKQNDFDNALNKISTLTKEKDIYKKILEDIFEKTSNHEELCKLCKNKGHNLPECICMTTEECLDTLYILYEKEEKKCLMKEQKL